MVNENSDFYFFSENALAGLTDPDNHRWSMKVPIFIFVREVMHWQAAKRRPFKRFGPQLPLCGRRPPRPGLRHPCKALPGRLPG